MDIYKNIQSIIKNSNFNILYILSFTCYDLYLNRKTLTYLKLYNKIKYTIISILFLNYDYMQIIYFNIIILFLEWYLWFEYNINI